MRVVLFFLLCASLCACTSKKEAKLQAQRAYMAGQQDAMRRMQQAAGANVVTIHGPFKNSMIPWEPDLTLAKALLVAEYLETRDPAEILLVRGGVAYRYEPAQLLSGRDVPLQQGDIVQVNLQPVVTQQPTR